MVCKYCTNYIDPFTRERRSVPMGDPFREFRNNITENAQTVDLREEISFTSPIVDEPFNIGDNPVTDSVFGPLVIGLIIGYILTKAEVI